MQLTKFPQSCLILEKAGERILIDPGSFALDAHHLVDFGAFSAVLYTHRHPDHFDPRLVDAVLDSDVALYGNADVAGVIGRGRCIEVIGGEAFTAAGFEVTPVDIPHVPLVNGAPGPPNTGYVIDGVLLHPGDGIDVDGIRVDILAAPIVGPSISLRDAYVLTEKVGAMTVVPIHYDFFPADPNLFAHFCDIADVVVLANGQSATVT